MPGSLGIRVMAVVVAAAFVFAPSEAKAQRKVRVLIKSEPGQVLIYIESKDNEPVGATPWRGRLAPGKYTLILSRDGFRDEIETIRVKRSRRTQTFSFFLEEEEYAYLNVQSSTRGSSGAAILVDGEEVGRLPQTVKIPAGAHQIEISKEGFETFDAFIDLEVEEHQTLDVELTPIDGFGDDDDDDDDDDTITKSAVGNTAAGAILRASAGIEIGGRRFKYSSRQGNLRNYATFGAPALRIRAELYPLGRKPSKLVSGIGFVFGFAQAAPLTSQTSDGIGVDSAWSDFELGVRYRYDAGEGVEVGGGISYGRQKFSFVDLNTPLDEALPDVDYRFIRLGMEIRAALNEQLSIEGGIGYRRVLSLGDLGERFPNDTVLAVGLDIAFTYRVLPYLDVIGSARYALFSHDFKTQPGDPFIAAGASDQFFSFLAGARYLY